MRRLALAALAALVACVLASGGLTSPAPAASPLHPPQVSPDNGTGMDLTDAFSHFSEGDPNTVVAYVEGGINWHLVPEAQQLNPHVYINWHETPVPCTGATTATAAMVIGGETQLCHLAYSDRESDYDPDGSGVVNALQWSHDPRVHDANHNGFIDAEDLIAAFSNNVDHDHDGYPNDISGWDFYDNQNDPATVDATYPHSDQQMLNLAGQCPDCLIMPIKADEEALDRTDHLAEAWLFAATSGVKVITSVTADLGYSSFMRQAINYCWDHGIVMVESSNDFDSTDHQGGMFWPHVVPGNGVMPSLAGTGWIRTDETSWGTHNMFSVAGQSSTSGATSALGGLFGLLMSWGQEAYERHLISAPLTGPRAVQVLQATASPINDTTLSWPGAPGDWSEQYGYGIPNLYKAMALVASGGVLPVATIDSPDWYSLEDPTTTAAVTVGGTISDRGSYSWDLEMGLGAQPASWTSIGRGKAKGAYVGALGVLNLSSVPESFWSAPFTLSSDQELSTSEQYTVTLRLVVVDLSGLFGTDRRAISVVHDPSWQPGTPLRVDSSGESQPALVDLQGTGRLDLVFGTADGTIEALDPATGRELPGWPAHTDPVVPLVRYPGVSPGDEPIVADVAVGDLDHTGQLSVVATSEDGKVYVFTAEGQLEPGWPKVLDTGVTPPPIPRLPLDMTRLPTVGALAAPVLADMTGDHTLDIVQAGWDGYLHVWEPDGANLPGWPVKVNPVGATMDFHNQFIDDQKLEATPAVVYFDGPGKPPTLVERTQYSGTKGSSVSPLGQDYVYAYNADGKLRPGWPVNLPSVLEYYGSAQESITEGTSSAVAADVTGTGVDEVVVSPVFGLPYLIDGSGLITGVYGAVAPGASAVTQAGTLAGELAHPLAGALLPDVPITFTTSGSFGKLGGVLDFAQSETGLLSLAAALEENSLGRGVNEYADAFPALGGPPAPGFPAQQQGIAFLSSPAFADVGTDGQDDMLVNSDSSALSAYGALGQEAPGFPKWTTGWSIFSPAVGDLYSNGRNEVVDMTREGYLFVWDTGAASAGNTQWWRWQHDEYNSGNYGTLSRPPGAVRNLSWVAGSPSATFTAPGSIWYSGRPTGYLVSDGPGSVPLTECATVSADGTQRIAVPAGWRVLTVQAVGPGDLLGTAATEGSAG